MKLPFSLLLLLSPLAFPGIFARPWPEPAVNGALENDKRGLISDIFTTVADLLSLDILSDVLNGIDTHPEVKEAFPGLHELLEAVKGDTITPQDFVRGLLNAIRDHPEYQKEFQELDPDYQEKVTQFIDGKDPESIVGKRSEFYIPPSPAAKHHFKRMEEVGNTPSSRVWLNAKRGESPVIYEDAAKTKVMKVYVSAPFENWGLTVKNTPAYTFVPTTVHGIQNLVKYAKTNNKRVRGAGYRHSWTDIFSEDDEILVSVLDLAIATAVPDPASLLPNAEHPGNELKEIELSTEDVPGSGGKKRLLRIGAAVTNEELRRWSVENNAWTMPLNVIMVEITLGGSNAPICHGAGIRHKTISDLVREISYVDANGNVQSVSDPELLKAAAGAFGLLGIVTHITLEVDKMTYAVMEPKKLPAKLGIPPPSRYIAQPGKIPPLLNKFYTTAQLEKARQEFVNRATQDYYTEWFWFPYQKDVFVNCWNATEDPSGVIDYPTPPDVFLQWIQGWLGGVINDSALFRALPGLWQAIILGTLAQTAQPPQAPGVNSRIKTYLTDALHFRRGVQNMRVRDLELQIPIPPLASDPTKPDYSIVQQAWWDAILAAYDDPKAPMRIAVEMRIMGDSDITMAPQTGNKFGTASIEVLTTMAAVADNTWLPYAQKVADAWMGLKDGKGVKLNVRPHWSKEWDGMTVGTEPRTPWREYLRTVSYKDEIPIFKSQLEAIGASQGWTLADVKARFSTPLLDDIFFHE